MFKKPKKHLFLIRRITLSVIATTAVLVIASASVLFMLGYRLDSGNGRLEQGALLQFDSLPGGATIWVDGRNSNSQTASKQTLLAGTHSIKMTKNGYEDWNRTLTIDAGTLTWLDYARLVPKDRPVEPVVQYAQLDSLTFSPDLKWGAALPDASKAVLQLLDLRSEAVKPSELILPPSAYTAASDSTSRFSMYRWNSEGRYLLMRHTYGKKQTEWLMVDTQDVAKSVNVTKQLSVNLVDVKFSGSSGNSLYGLMNDGVLRKLDIAAGTISRALIAHVSSFSVLDGTNILSFSGTDTTDANIKVVGIYKDGESKPTILKTSTDAASPLAIAVGRYFSDPYVAIAEGNMVTILAGSLPSEGAADTGSLRTSSSFTLKGAVTALSFSKEGAFVVAQSGSEFAGYEVEHKRVGTSSVAAAHGTPAGTLRWLDEAHLWNDDGDTLVMRDFDGANSHSIMPVTSGFGVTLSTNGKFMYAVGKTDSGYQLQRVRMILQ